jgi:hypothetical protein
MFEHHVIDPQTLLYKETKTPDQGDLVELRFVSAPHVEYIFGFDSLTYKQINEQLYGRNRKSHPMLPTAEKINIMTYILYGQYCLWARDNHFDNVDVQYGFDGCWYVLVSRDNRHRIYVLCYEKVDHTFIVDEFVYPALAVADAKACTPVQLRMLLPVLWNESRKCFDDCYNGDNCRVRFVYPYDRTLWTEQSLSEAVARYKEQGLKI